MRPTDTWDPTTYRRFQAERQRPVEDLLTLIEPVDGGRMLDLGCGDGEITRRVAMAIGAGEAIGVDRSSAMLDRTTTDGPTDDRVRFVEGDLMQVTDDVAFDLVFANASLQWTPDQHAALGHAWSLVGPGGQLAVQVPANFEHPSHTVADDLGRRFGLEPLSRSERALTAPAYATLLHEFGATDQHVRLVVYGAELERSSDVIEWVRGSLLTHYRRELGDDRFAEFLEQYRSRLLERLGDPTGASAYFFAFPRILMWARRG